MTVGHIIDQFILSDKFQLYFIKCDAMDIMKFKEYLSELGIRSLNIGYEMATFISKKTSLKYINIEAAEYLNEIVSENANTITGLNIPCISIFNTGILFEPALSLDAKSILKGLSKKIIVLICGEGKVLSGEKLVWNEENIEIGFDYKDINIKEIKINYEV